jgi:hypothetical protein
MTSLLPHLSPRKLPKEWSMGVFFFDRKNLAHFFAHIGSDEIEEEDQIEQALDE